MNTKIENVKTAVYETPIVRVAIAHALSKAQETKTVPVFMTRDVARAYAKRLRRFGSKPSTPAKSECGQGWVVGLSHGKTLSLK